MCLQSPKAQYIKPIQALHPKIRNRIGKRRPIIPSPGQRLPIPHNHIRSPHGTQRINLQRARLAINRKHLALAVLRAIRRRARGVVVVEKAVQTRAVDDRVAGVEEAEAQRVAIARQAGAVVRVVDGVAARVWAVSGIGLGLVVWRFGLGKGDQD